MKDKDVIFTKELSKQLIQLRFENDWLFKKKKQPWKEFHKILLENGFPEDITLKQITKRYTYLYDLYKGAKKEKNKKWTYYKLFDKYYGKTKVPDKYESWDDEWRLKFITCVSEAKALKLENQNFWLTIERAMRSQDLPLDCCIQDLKGLWRHIKQTFQRKRRVAVRQGSAPDWPLYAPLLEYCSAHEPHLLHDGPTHTHTHTRRPRPRPEGGRERGDPGHGYAGDTDLEDEYDFQWTKDITETFIQVRFQNDWIFKTKKWAWRDLKAIMVKEYGFPKELSSRDICKKWATTYASYQKAKAMNNKAWIYYSLFELYYGEGSLTLDPLVGWREEWVLSLISVRSDLQHLFRLDSGDRDNRWREVEKILRGIGLPLDHSLLDLQEIWMHLDKTYQWKKKFQSKGILKEQWPYFEAMSQYEAIKGKSKPNTPKGKHKKKPKFEEYNVNDGIHALNDSGLHVVNDSGIRVVNDSGLNAVNDSGIHVVNDNGIHVVNDNGIDDDEYEDDIKLFDLKQRLEPKPQVGGCEGGMCRCCTGGAGSGAGGCVNLFQGKDEDGFSLADKLKVIGGVLVQETDHLPPQICLNCLKQLESAFKFRRKCQLVDKHFRCDISYDIKLEATTEDNDTIDNRNPDNNHNVIEELGIEGYQTDAHTDTEVKREKQVKKERAKVPRRRKRVKKDKYFYLQVCEVCGKHTKNLPNHMDSHSTIKAYSCEVCDKKFKFKSGLTVHRAVHNPVPKKTCEVCGKTFHVLAAYRKHFVYHANERKHECETCGKRFNTLDILKVHNMIHTEERPFSCPDCGKAFRTAGCVSRHKRIVHKTNKNQ